MKKRVNMGKERYLKIIKISSLNGYLEKINEVYSKEELLGDFIYRGQSNESWAVDCCAKRRLKKTNVTFDEILEYQETQLISRIRQQGRERVEGHKLDELDILAMVQHYGGATMMIDFTRRSLLALWFACEPNNNKDGAVYICNIEDRNKFEKLGPEDASKPIHFLKSKEKKLDLVNYNTREESINKEVAPHCKYCIDSVDKDSTIGTIKLYYWEPHEIIQRIKSQDSVFIFGMPEIPKDYLYKFTIKSKNKKTIRKQLKYLENISEITLFDDLYGFSSANNQYKDIDDIDPEELYEQGKEYLNTKQFKQAIKMFNKVLSYKKDDPYLLANMGWAKIQIQDFGGAIQDYDKAIELKSNESSWFENRSMARFLLESTHLSKKTLIECLIDLDIAIKLNDRNNKLYLRRSMIKGILGDTTGSFEDSTRGDPKNGIPYIFEAFKLIDSNRSIDKAIEYLKKGIKLAKNQNVHNGLIKEAEGKLAKLRNNNN